MIVIPKSAAYVADIVRFAAAQGLQVGLRSGGHSYSASALRDGGIMLDLGALDGIEVDERSRTAWVEPGVKGGQLIERLAEHNLAFPIGHCADVALGGYLLSGGFGWNSGAWGPACANLLEVELVLASGETVRAGPAHYADLFWAARGAGSGFFAVATRFRLRLHDLPKATFAASVCFVNESAPLLADWLNRASQDAHPAAEVTCLVGPHIESGRPAILLRAEAAGEDHKEARDRIAPLLSPPAAAERISAGSERFLSFAELTQLSAMPANRRVAADHMWSSAPIGEMLLAVHHLAAIPDKASTVNLFGLGGRGTVPYPPDEGEFALSVGGGTAAGIYALWQDPAHDARHLDWVRQVDDALAPFRIGRYIGETDLTSGAGRLQECFTPAALRRIEQLRQRYDPRRLFGEFQA